MIRYEVESTIEKKDLNQMVMGMILFSNNTSFFILGFVALVAGIAHWLFMSWENRLVPFVLAAFYFMIILLLLTRRSISINRKRGTLDMVGKPQYFNFYDHHLSYKTPMNEDFLNISYDSILYIKKALGFIFVRFSGNRLLSIKVEDSEARAIINLVKDSRR